MSQKDVAELRSSLDGIKARGKNVPKPVRPSSSATPASALKPCREGSSTLNQHYLPLCHYGLHLGTHTHTHT